MVPDDLRQKMDDLRTQAEGISKSVLAADAGSLSDRLSVLEAKLDDIQGGEGVKDLSARIRGLEVTMGGQAQLADLVAELSKIVDAIDGQVNQLDDQMAEARQTPGSALGQTIQGF